MREVPSTTHSAYLSPTRTNNFGYLEFVQRKDAAKRGSEKLLNAVMQYYRKYHGQQAA